jgi:hypothetical protein
VIDSLHSLRELRHVLQRLGTAQVARFWSNQPMVFLSNLLGGTATGAVAFIVAAIILGLDINRGENSTVVHLVHALQTIAATFRTLFERELR